MKMLFCPPSAPPVLICFFLKAAVLIYFTHCTTHTLNVHAGHRWRLFPGEGWGKPLLTVVWLCQWPSISENFFPLTLLIGIGECSLWKQQVDLNKTTKQNKEPNRAKIPGRNLVSLSHDARPGSWSRQGLPEPPGTVAFLLGWGGSFFLHTCNLGNVSGEPQGKTTSCQDDAASVVSLRQAGSGIPEDFQEQNTCTTIVTGVMSIVTKNLKHPQEAT